MWRPEAHYHRHCQPQPPGANYHQQNLALKATYQREPIGTTYIVHFGQISLTVLFHLAKAAERIPHESNLRPLSHRIRTHK